MSPFWDIGSGCSRVECDWVRAEFSHHENMTFMDAHAGYAGDFGPFDRIWLNTAHQGPMPRVAAEAAMLRFARAIFASVLIFITAANGLRVCSNFCRTNNSASGLTVVIQALVGLEWGGFAAGWCRSASEKCRLVAAWMFLGRALWRGLRGSALLAVRPKQR